MDAFPPHGLHARQQVALAIGRACSCSMIRCQLFTDEAAAALYDDKDPDSTASPPRLGNMDAPQPGQLIEPSREALAVSSPEFVWCCRQLWL